MATTCLYRPIQRSSRLLLIAAASAVLAFGVEPARAADAPVDSSAAKQFIQHALHDAFATFSGGPKSHDQREQLAEALVRRYADMDRISATILGPYWDKARDEQRRQFTSLLVDYGLSVWARPMTGGAMNEQQLRIGSTTPAAADVVVHTFIRSSGQQVPIDWTVAAEPDHRLVITNVTADNVSFVRTMRDDFESYLHHHDGGLNGLMSALQAKIDKNVADAQ